ncbi:MAG: hypothetical protein RI958_2587 [Actinomycetota bacterium]
MTVEMLGTVGESGVRVGAVAEAAGVGIGLINYHFGSRDGLVAAAQLVRFSAQIDRELDQLEVTMSRIASRADVVTVMNRIVQGLVGAAQVEGRLGRIDALGAAHGRPSLLAEIGQVQTQLRRRFGRMLHGLQDLGHVRADIDADALATLLLSLSAGLVIYDVEAEPCPADAVLAALELFVERCVVAPVSASSQRP